MASLRSIGSSRRLASRAALAALALATGTTAHEKRADACGWSEPTLEEITTFDPAVAGDVGPDGLLYDPFVSEFGGPCSGCDRQAMDADWSAYFGKGLALSDWNDVLYSATPGDLNVLRKAVKGTGTGGKYAAIVTAVKARPTLRDPVSRALDYVDLARASETMSTGEGGGGAAGVAASAAGDADNGLKAAQKAKDAFLAQRFAFQHLRVAFYANDFADVVAFFDKSSAVLAKPSADLAARARYYLAGALRKTGNQARANLEFARVAMYPGLATVAAQDFQPMEDKDWKATLAMAKDTREKTMLWRLVGLKQDGVTAAQEIAKLDPSSTLISLLVVREVTRIETKERGLWGSPDPNEVAAANKESLALEQLAMQLAGNGKADRPWLLQLAAGHLAARRGDLSAARQRLTAAVKARPNDPGVAAQANASLAMAIAQSGPLTPTLADELARTMTGVDPKFSRRETLTLDVRASLAAASTKAGNVIDAEFLTPGTAPATQWADVAFLKQMIARTDKQATDYDRFVLASQHSRGSLEAELALRYLVDGNFTAADQEFTKGKAASSTLGTDPFVIHLVDCHDCDHATYASAPWTHASFAAKLAKLAKAAAGKGQAAADASLQLGNAFYNITWYGNARVVLAETHQATSDTATALRWYKRAYDLSTNREFKVKAAIYAAKAEMAQLITKQYPQPSWDNADQLPVPTTWYPIVKKYADTKYYQDILRECGTFKTWAAH